MSKTVKDLIEELSKLPQDLQVKMSSDGEGNNFSEYADAGVSAWVQHNDYWGESVHPDDVDDHEGDLKTVVILWPI